MNLNGYIFNIIDDTTMRTLGFLDYTEDSWIYTCDIPVNKHAVDMYNYSLELFLDKDATNYALSIVNDDTGDTFDYDYMLEHAPEFEWLSYINNQLTHIFKKFEHYGLVRVS